MSSSTAQVRTGRCMRWGSVLGYRCPFGSLDGIRLARAFGNLHTVSVSAHGGLLALGTTVQKGQAILVENRNTWDEREFRVVYVTRPQDGKCRVGIEFVH